MKKLLLKFVRRFYDPNLAYVDRLIDEWVNKFVRFFIYVIFNGFMVWLVFVALKSLIPLNWPILGPGVWHLLNILQLGLISWFLKGLIQFIRRKK